MNDFKGGSGGRPAPAHSSGGMQVRKASPQDFGEIKALLIDLELTYPAMDFDCFYVAEKNGEIIATAELKELEDCCLLSCVGVRENLQHTGIGRDFTLEVLRHAAKDVYLYTLVPGFFKKLGFIEAVILPPGLPGRAIYGCQNCDPTLCRCLVRTSNAS
jgi:N-acetylglutamate synthase-like GNAT family acetyltransferase